MKIIHITDQMPDACEYCGRTHDEGQPIDLRPYGKHGEWICYDCGMSPDNKATTEQMLNKVLSSADVFITGDDPRENRKSN